MVRRRCQALAPSSAPDRDRAPFKVEQKSDSQTQRHTEWYTDDHVEGITNHLPKQRVAGKHPAIVCQADKARGIKNVVIAEASDDGEENWAAGEEDKTDNPWRSTEPTARPLRTQITAARSFD